MKKSYEMNRSVESKRAENRAAMLESDVAAKRDWVKRNEEFDKKLMGKKPELKREAEMFNAYMCNDGKNAEEFAKDLTRGIDEKAFPVG